MISAERALKELCELHHLSWILFEAGRKQDLHREDWISPPPEDGIFYDPEDVALARKHRGGPAVPFKAHSDQASIRSVPNTSSRQRDKRS